MEFIVPSTWVVHFPRQTVIMSDFNVVVRGVGRYYGEEDGRQTILSERFAGNPARNINSAASASEHFTPWLK